MYELDIITEKHRELERQILKGAALVQDLRLRLQQMDDHADGSDGSTQFRRGVYVTEH